MTTQTATPSLSFRGGTLGALTPLILLVLGLIYLSVFERAGTKATETCVLMRAGKRALLDACKQLTTRRRRPRIESF